MPDVLVREFARRAAEAGDAGAIRKLISRTPDFMAAIRGGVHPITASATTEIFELLAPYARPTHFLFTLYGALTDQLNPLLVKPIVELAPRRLRSALRDGHIWLDQGVKGDSALHVAILFGCVEGLKLLLTLFPELELRSSDGATALGLAVQAGDIQIAEVLLNAGADPTNGIERIGAEPNLEMALLLLNRGARTTAVAGTLLSSLAKSEWSRVIHQAAPASAWPVDQVSMAFRVVDPPHARDLLAAGANSAAAQNGSVQNPDREVLSVTAPDLGRLEPAAFGELVCCPHLLADALRAGLPADSRDQIGRTLLTLLGEHLAMCHAATDRNRLYHSLEVLIAAGADLTGRTGRGSPIRAFLSTPRRTEVATLRHLLLRGLRDPLALHHLMRTPMYDPSLYLQLLLEWGFDPNKTDNTGSTPLHLLAADILIPTPHELACLLLQAGADSALKDRRNRTALDIALEAHNVPVIDVLQAERRQYQSITLRESIDAGKTRRRQRSGLPI